jgi:hypothetical protein
MRIYSSFNLCVKKPKPPPQDSGKKKINKGKREKRKKEKAAFSAYPAVGKKRR